MEKASSLPRIDGARNTPAVKGMIINVIFNSSVTYPFKKNLTVSFTLLRRKLC